MAEVGSNPFDPPEPDPESRRRPRVYIAPPLDPEERVRQGFQQLRIEDRRMDSPMNWLPSHPFFPVAFDPTKENPYNFPTLDPEYSMQHVPFPSVKDLYNPLSAALGVKGLDRKFDDQLVEKMKKYKETTMEADRKRGAR